MDDSIASLKIGIMEDSLKIFNIIMENDDTNNSQNEDTKTENECFDGELTPLLGGIVETMCGKMTSETGYSADSQSLLSNDALRSTEEDTMLAVYSTVLAAVTDIPEENSSHEEKRGENFLTTLLWEVDEPISDEIAYELGCKDDNKSLISFEAPGSPGQDTILAVDATEQMDKVKSWVWNYAKRVGDKAYCDLCEENSNNEFSCVGGTTGSVLRHLKNIHNICISNQQESNKTQSEESNENINEQSNAHNLELCDTEISTFTSTSSSTVPSRKRRRRNNLTSERNDTTPCSPERTEIIHQAVAKMVALNQLPISFCSSAGFHYFMSIVEPNYKAIKEEALKKRLYALKTDIKEKVKEKLRSAQSVSCTSDCWSSLSQQSYITIGAHIIDTQWCPISFTLTTHELHERHTAENLTQQLENTFNEWEIDKKVVAVVTDNAKNIVNAVTSLSYIPEVCSSTCAAHSLQLCINNSLKTDTITEIIQKCSKLVGHFKHSNVAMNELHKKQEQLGYPKSSLLQYCKTRWNSIYTMLDRLFINRSVILSVLTDRSITTSDICRKLEITENQWCLIETLICLLKPFYVLTTVLCKENHSPVSMVRPLLHKVIENHLKSQHDDNIIIKDFRKTVVNELTKRFNLQFEITNIISVSHISSFLDPRYKDLEHEPIHVREEIRNHVKNVLNNIVVHQQQPQQHTSIAVAFYRSRESRYKHAPSPAAFNECSVWPGDDDATLFSLAPTIRELLHHK
ncbi:hypothetical protein ACI65C_000849 [Semiaphis heraclei]